MTKTFFVSGVAGFLGSHLADALVAEGHRVIGVDNLIGGYPDNVNPEVEFHQFDLNDRIRLVPLLSGVDTVYHCAALAHEGLSVISPHTIVQSGSGATVALASAAAANKVRRFVFCSSMARYGYQPITPFTEDMIPNPRDPYGEDKLYSEKQIRNISETHGMEYVIAVPHNIIGARQKYDDPFRNVVSIMVNLMLQGAQPIIYGDGEQTRSFSPVEDIIPLFRAMSEAPDVVGEVINIGPDDEPVSVNEVARKLAVLTNFGPLEPRYKDDRPREVKHATCSAEKSRRLLGYRKTVSLDESLRTVVDYVRKRGPLPFRYHIELEIVNDKTPKSWSERLF